MLPKWWMVLPPRWRPTALRLGFNWFPAWRATGARVLRVAPDMGSLVVALPLHRGTRNAMGTLFGGALFAATDGIHPTLLALQLGPGYILWDKAGAIRYRRPGRTTLYGEFALAPGEAAEVRRLVARDGECERTYTVLLKDSQGVVHTEVERTVYIADKAFFRRKGAAGPGGERLGSLSRGAGR